MVDLQAQYLHIKNEVDQAIEKVLSNANFINGEEVGIFSDQLSKYLEADFGIPCANGTDALQVALMALNLPTKSEILVPAFCYIAAAEVIAMLGYVPVFVDVDENTFNIDPKVIEKYITEQTKVIIPVHLFGQSCDMLSIIKLAQKYNLYIIEDNAQSIGAVYKFPDGNQKFAGTIGHIGTTSFFPSKNLGCMGDGGAIFTNDEALADKMKMIVNHGQKKKYYHDIVGINSRLDTLQASILSVKLSKLDLYTQKRQEAAKIYDSYFQKSIHVETPITSSFTTHVFHQYTLKINNGRRNELKQFLDDKGIPAMIYYPVPLHLQQAFAFCGLKKGNYPISEKLCDEVISLPMHTELTLEQQTLIASSITEFLNG